MHLAVEISQVGDRTDVYDIVRVQRLFGDFHGTPALGQGALQIFAVLMQQRKITEAGDQGWVLEPQGPLENLELLLEKRLGLGVPVGG